MRRPWYRPWLVLSVCGAVGVLGCNHARHHCNCVATVQPATSVVMLPAPAPQPPADLASPTKAEPVFQTIVAKKEEPPAAPIAVPLIAGGDPKTGTIELSAADAEAMGVKPGYTPGALYMPPR